MNKRTIRRLTGILKYFHRHRKLYTLVELDNQELLRKLIPYFIPQSWDKNKMLHALSNLKFMHELDKKILEYEKNMSENVEETYNNMVELAHQIYMNPDQDFQK